MSLNPGQSFGSYEIVRLLGSGGMGEVYLAKDLRLNRPVAIKILSTELIENPELLARFHREARLCASLSHPGVCTIHETGRINGSTYICMEYVEGKNLREVVAESVLPIETILDISIQIADALEEARKKNIIHRDIKSANVILTPRNQVKILDFGLARRLRPAEIYEGSNAATESSITQFGTVRGTVAYMAPEQALGKDVDHRSDIFSFGVLLYEMLTGKLPFMGSTVTEVIDAILHKTPVPVTRYNDTVPPDLVRVLNKMLDKDPEMRYQSVHEVWADLRRIKAEMTEGKTKKARHIPFVKRPVFAVVTLLLITAIALVLFFNRRPLNFWKEKNLTSSLQELIGSKTLPSQKHLVVLPFINVGGMDAHQAFCDGLAETLTTQLTQLGQFHGALWVVPMSDVRKEAVTSAREAREAFGITLVVTGSVQRQSDSIRLTANLVDAKTLRQVRAVTIETKIASATTLQDGVLQQVADMLELRIDGQAQRVVAAGATPIGRAYDFYLQGQGYLQRYEKIENLDAAVSAFQQALQQDPNYALAYAGLAMAYWHRYDFSKDSKWVDLARKHCKRAMDLNDQLAPIHVTFGTIETGTGNFEQAIGAFQRALKLDMLNPEALLGLAQAYEEKGDFKQAESTYLRAIDLQPNIWYGYNSLGSFYFDAARYEEAAKSFEYVIRLVPDSFRGYSNLAGAYLILGRYSEAIPVLEKSISIRRTSDAYWNLGYTFLMLRRFPKAAITLEEAVNIGASQHYSVWGLLGDAYYWSEGQRPKARTAYERALALAEEELKVNPRSANALVMAACYSAKLGRKMESIQRLQQALALKPNNPEFLFLAALVYNRLGETTVALDWLQRALDGGYPRAEIRNNFEFDNLQAHRRFRAFLQKP